MTDMFGFDCHKMFFNYEYFVVFAMCLHPSMRCLFFMFFVHLLFVFRRVCIFILVVTFVFISIKIYSVPCFLI